MSRFKQFPLHPFLFGLYPVLALVAHNLDQIKPVVAWRSIIVLSLLNLIIFVLFQVVFRNWHRSAVASVLFAILFYSYGHFYEVLNNSKSILSLLARHRYLFPLSLGFLIAGLLWVRQNSQKFTSTTPFLNLISIIVVFFPLIQIAAFKIKMQIVYSEYQEEGYRSQQIAQDKGIEIYPDIYYIILDGYSRDDILLENYGYDNTPFITTMIDMGFFIARCSQSNYAQTELSMASALNMNYLDNLGDSFVEGSEDRSDLWPLLDYGLVRQLLEDIGYKSVAFETGFYWIQWEDADFYLAPIKSRETGETLFGRGFNSFEEMLIQTTMGRILIDTDLIKQIREFFPQIESSDLLVRNRTLFVLDQLRFDKVPAILGPKFVYAHILSPHDPFVFGPNGESAQPGENFTYIDQVIFINSQIEEIVSEIIKNSEIPPIIILQGDHGYGTQSGRMAILNAIYLPNLLNENVYPDMTPVNTFRLVFNEFFGGEYVFLEDVSYYSTYEKPYDYEVIPRFRQDCGE